jgi:hypothetical protein
LVGLPSSFQRFGRVIHTVFQLLIALMGLFQPFKIFRRTAFFVFFSSGRKSVGGGVQLGFQVRMAFAQLQNPLVVLADSLVDLIQALVKSLVGALHGLDPVRVPVF